MKIDSESIVRWVIGLSFVAASAAVWWPLPAVAATTMRIKFFLRAAHADRLVNATELINLTAIDQFSGFSWIANLLKNVESVGASETDEAADRARLQSVHRHWIVGQQEYFRRRIRSLERDHRRLEKLKSVMMYMIATFALVLGACAQKPNVDPRLAVTTPTPPKVVAEGDPVPKGGGVEQSAEAAVTPTQTFVAGMQPDGYSAEGYASWYGSQFHGRMTSNGLRPTSRCHSP